MHDLHNAQCQLLNDIIDEKYRYQCTLCFSKSESKVEMEKHMREFKHNARNRKEYLPITDEKSIDEYISRQHKNQNEHLDVYNCLCKQKDLRTGLIQDCAMKQTGLILIKKHIKASHIKEQIRCKVCLVKFQKIGGMMKHLIDVH